MHIINSTLVYPFGESPDGSELGPSQRRFELYDFQTGDRPPVVGEVREFPEGKWIVVAVETYQPAQSCNFEAFHVAICTLDGTMPERYDWSDGLPLVLHLFTQGTEIVEIEPGFADYGLAADLRSVPKSSAEILLFKPIGDRPLAGYDIITVCQLKQVPVAA